MAGAVHAFDWLERASEPKLPPMVVLFGSDGFLTQLSLESLIASSGVDPDAVQKYDGPEAKWREVYDELATLSLFDASHHRIAIIREADKFITANRAYLEKWLEAPPPDAVLVLEASSFPGTTKLYKQVVAKGTLVNCNPPTLASFGNPVDEKKIEKWLITWALRKHKLNLEAKQIHIMLERVGTELGMLDCELAKLSLFASDKGEVPDSILKQVVGGWRTQTMWDISDSIADGQIGEALDQVDRLLKSGQAVIGLFAPLAWSLRRFGLAAQLIEQTERFGSKPNMGVALEKAGFRKFDIKKAETQLRRIGRKRAKDMLHWIVELEMKLKGSHSNEHFAKFALEEFLMRLK